SWRAEWSGPEAPGELTIVAVGPYAHEIIGHHEADFEIPRHVGQPGRDLCSSSGSDAIAVHGQVGIQQSRYMVLTHRVHGDERKQINRFLVDLSVLLAGKDRADVLPEALHAIEVGRLAARDVLQLTHDPQQGYVIEVHCQPPSPTAERHRMSRRLAASARGRL